MMGQLHFQNKFIIINVSRELEEQIQTQCFDIESTEEGLLRMHKLIKIKQDRCKCFYMYIYNCKNIY